MVLSKAKSKKTAVVAEALELHEEPEGILTC